MRARPWTHPGPGAQYSNFIDKEIEVQKVIETCLQSHRNEQNRSLASQVKAS